ncbi:FAD binding domain containing protein [Rhypophila decipiens]
MTRRHRLALLVISITVFIPIAAVIYHRLVNSSFSGFNPFSSQTTTTTTMTESKSASPIIVVGSGLAGLSAAYTALQSGAPSVLMLERAPKPGGNSIKASSGINGAPTRYQPHPKNDQEDANDVKSDEIESFLSDTFRSAGSRLSSSNVSPSVRKQREELISVLVNNSSSAIDFLTQDLGIDLSVVAQLGGHSHARTHRGSGKTPPGAAIVTTLLSKLKEFGEESFVLKTAREVTRILTADEGDRAGQVVGVEYRNIGAGDGPAESEIALGPVIFATGGFAGDTHGLLSKYRPDLAGLPSTNEPRPGAHKLLTSVGAKLIDMDSVQIHPTGFIDPANPGSQLKFLAAEMLRGEGGILLHKGRRFVNELDTREKVSGLIMGLEPLSEAESGGLKQWDVQILLDPGATEAAAGHVGFYVWKGLLKKVKVKDLDEATRETLREYARVVRGEKKDELGRKAFGHWRLGISTDGTIDDEEEVCIGSVTPITHFTMGGAVFDRQAAVLKTELGEKPQRPIGGIWAAGEITGGIHGDNRLGGSSLLECVVFGRIAGQQAAAAVHKS